MLGPRALVMGIVNVTPDSFSDGGLWLDPAAAIAHGQQLAAEGADILDVGAESTRPGAAPVSVDDEIARAIPVIRALAQTTRVPISIDTMKAPVARAAIEAGATIVNDVWGFQFDPDIARVAADARAHCILMHNRREDDAVRRHVRRSRRLPLALARHRAEGRRLARQDRRRSGHRLRQDARAEFRDDPAPAGAAARISACRFCSAPRASAASASASGVDIAAQRVAGSIAAHLWGAMHGADIVRVHDVAAHRQALGVLFAIEGAGRGRTHMTLTARILIEQLEVHAYHGWHAHEEEFGQPFTVDLELEADISREAASDDLHDALDYAAIVRVTRKLFVEKRYKLVEARRRLAGARTSRGSSRACAPSKCACAS